MLYIVGTPIGNLEDLSLRQVKTITEADIILTEDTRSTGILLQKIKQLFNLAPKENQQMISYYKEKEFEKLPRILQLLQEEKNIVLISESGMPLISDPGYLLIKNIIKEKISFTVIPGPTAAMTALVASGLSPQFSLFIGFLPKRQSELEKLFKQFIKLKSINEEITFISYESPARINNTLVTLEKYFPGHQVVIARELTKKFEEIIRGSAEKLKNRQYKGEIVLIF